MAPKKKEIKEEPKKQVDLKPEIQEWIKKLAAHKEILSLEHDALRELEADLLNMQDANDRALEDLESAIEALSEIV